MGIVWQRLTAVIAILPCALDHLSAFKGREVRFFGERAHVVDTPLAAQAIEAVLSLEVESFKSI